MKRIALYRCAAIAGLAVAWAAQAGRAAPAAPDVFDTVVLDAGHGGEDAGARGPAGALEKNVVLAVVRDLAARLSARDLRVEMTRDRDVFVPLERRTAIANDARGDLFLSIHANAAEDAAVGGTETYFLALDASDAGAARVAERENSAFATASGSGVALVNDPFIALLGDLIATEYLRESNDVAQRIQIELGGIESMRSRGVKQGLFVVLTGVQMPAALVEIGFITHPEDERSLTSARGRRSVVDSLERAVLEFGRRYDARRLAPTPARSKR
ncbi:MAG: N-acetylmuramoyl-L-alanine amidase [Myxococcales bacterium]|nr:N-acetylmuramoyl-L-alanine amidase [Myxococcales bacterium]MDH5566987.1 N-acetylmuramoyl-L-alanine amidase [Myxococcales bacterium]